VVRRGAKVKPHVSILMVTSIDGRLHPCRFTSNPDGARRDWSTQYDAAIQVGALEHGAVHLLIRKSARVAARQGANRLGLARTWVEFDPVPPR
jgi:hypothetical protein